MFTAVEIVENVYLYLNCFRNGELFFNKKGSNGAGCWFVDLEQIVKMPNGRIDRSILVNISVQRNQETHQHAIKSGRKGGIENENSLSKYWGS